MNKYGSLLGSALLICLAVAGCESSSDTEGDGLAAKGGELERPDAGRGSGEPAPPRGDGDPNCGPIVPEADAAAPTNPCAALLCPPNARCEVQQVQCVRAPCPPIATCVPVSVDPPRDAGAGPGRCAVTLCQAGTTCIETARGAQCVPVATCAATLCKTGTNCVETDRGAQCVPITTCAATLCRAGTTCVETAQGPECVDASSCKGFTCGAGTHCELEAVQCIRAPCPANPICVPDVDACAAVRCRAGTHCELKQVTCVRAPCDPVAECVAD
jgi:hypothetical protein